MSASTTQPVKVVFVAGGQGSQFRGMGYDLYQNDQAFRYHLNSALPADDPTLGRILRSWERQDESSVAQASYAQTLLAAISFASARRLHDMGVVPDVLLGHSAGEFALACFSGLVDRADLPNLLGQRAQFLDGIDITGAMAAVRGSEIEVQRLIDETELPVFMATINSPNQCVVGGQNEVIAAFCDEANQRSLLAIPAESNLPFHTPLMSRAVESFSEVLSGVRLQPLAHPLFSTVANSWLTDTQVTSSQFWASHLSRPVKFWNSLETILQQGDCLFVDLGPGTSLSAVIASHPTVRHGQSRVVSLMPVRSSPQPHQLWLERAQSIADDMRSNVI